MNKAEIVKKIASEIKKYCTQNSISFNELVLRCELTYSTLHNIISYKTKNIELITLCKICNGMGIDLVTFIEKL